MNTDPHMVPGYMFAVLFMSKDWVLMERIFTAVCLCHFYTVCVFALFKHISAQNIHYHNAKTSHSHYCNVKKMQFKIINI